jgi:hypothetical protein
LTYERRVIEGVPYKKYLRPQPTPLPQSTLQTIHVRKVEQLVSQNSNSVSVKVVGADKKSTVVFSSTGESPLPPSAGVPLTVAKTAGGKITTVAGTISGVVVELPESAK